MHLTGDERDILAGGQGEARRFAMDILTRFGDALGADRLLPVSQSHVDGCLYHGDVSLDFVEKLVADGGKVSVPTTLNVGSMDLLHPELIGGDDAFKKAGRRLMEAHLTLGCEPSFTCAPYQTRFRPQFGDQVAWGESNAIVFANSVIGARTNRYGDFIDLLCGMVGRAPAFGLHLDENRFGEVLFRLTDASSDPETLEALYVATGYVIGARSGGRIPVIEGLPPPRSEDQLKALGAVAASSGAVALFHAIGITPEAPDRRTAFGGRYDGYEIIEVSRAELQAAIDQLSTAPTGTPISAISLGTPHFSLAEFQLLDGMLAGFSAAPDVAVYVNTGRETFEAITASGLAERLSASGITVLTDTCTYVTSITHGLDGVVMTNSGKWAHYAPGNIGVGVAFGSLAECLQSAMAGRIIRRPL